jgi:hypothetical protein
VNAARLALALALAAGLALLAGCGGDRARATTSDPQEMPWPEQGAPDALHALMEDLLAYQSANGRMPPDLAHLDRSGLATAGPYAKLHYAYHPAGLGLLPHGWRILVVDDRVREADHVWCIIRQEARGSGAMGTRVVLVPMADLRAAASTAGGLR